MLDRPITLDSLKRTRLREFEQHQLTISEQEDSEAIPSISKTFGIMKALDMVPIHLRERIRTHKVTLKYVICDNSEPAILEALEIDRITSENYTSK